MDAPQLAALLGSDAPGDRAQALAALEAVSDVALAVACVAPLTAVFARPVEEVGAAELQRACLALAHMTSLDCVAVGGEWMKGGKIWAVYASEDNALNTMLRKPVAELSRSDCLLAAAVEAAWAAGVWAKGFDPVMQKASTTFMEVMGAFMAAIPYGPVLGTDERTIGSARWSPRPSETSARICQKES